MGDRFEDDTKPLPLPRRKPRPERRRAHRRRVVVPAQVDTAERATRFAVTQNVSESGALLATPSRFKIGERAFLRFLTSDGRGSDEAVEARVVRLELNERDRMGIWPYFVAVRFTSVAPAV